MSSEIYKNAMTGGITVNTQFSYAEISKHMTPQVLAAVIDKVAEHVAAEFVEKFGMEIMAKLDPVAIANVTVAAAGAKVNETLNKKLPDRIDRVVERITEKQIYQRGVFGGLKRLR